MTPPPLPENYKDKEQINLLVIFHYVWAGLCVVGVAFILLYCFFMASFFTMMGEMEHDVGGPDPEVEEVIVIQPKVASEEHPISEVAEDAVMDPAVPEKAQEARDTKRVVNSFRVMDGFFRIIIYFYVVIGVFLLILAIMNLMSAHYLRKRRKRLFIMVTAGFNCACIPFGTALGVFTLIVLSRPSVEALYRKDVG